MIDQFVGKTLAEKYKIEELLSEGEFGNVYSARHLLMEKPVTIKVLAPVLAVDESIVESFSIEARTISRLSHPNILNVTDFGRDTDGTVFIVMENTEGKTLKDAILSEGAFSVDRAVRIARQLAAGLSAAHANMMVHGHLTSENVLLTKMANDSELVKILNIGSFDSVRRENYEDEGSLKDLAYLSPEQCSGESKVDERTDIYALGIIFYEMLVGEVPFEADNPTDLMMKHAEVPPPPFAAFRDDIPGEIEPLAIQALAKNPDMRYQTASAFAEDLSEALSLDRDESPMIVPHAAAQADSNSNNVWKTAFIVLAGVSLMAFGMIYWTNTKQTNPTTVQQVDENGQPVQPLNPATGLNEQIPNMADYPTNSLDPNDPLVQSDVGGGDGYDPWARPGTPPGGSPSYVPVGPAENMVTIPGDSGSIFNREEPVGYDAKGNPIYLVKRPVQNPTPAPTTDDAKKPGEVKKDPKAVGKNPNGTKPPAAKPTPKPSAKTDKKPDTKPVVKKPATKKPVEKPKTKTPQPATKSQNAKSGVERDS